MNRGIICVMTAAVFCAAVSCEMPSTGRGQVAGQVTQTSNGEPVEGVLVEYAGIRLLTDALGMYFLDTIPEGLQGITFSKTGYATLVSQVDVPRDAAAENNVSITVMSGGWAVGAVETEYGTIFHTDDGGLNWIRQGSYTTVPSTDLKCVCAVNERCCWAAGDTIFNVLRNRMEYTILKTSDAGAVWRRQGQSIGSLEPYPIVDIAAVDTATAYAVTDTNIILKATAGGSSWASCRSSDYTARYRAVSTCDGVHVWAGGSPTEGGYTGLDYTADGGSTWKFVPVAGMNSGETITGITSVDTSFIYVSGTFGVMRTLDGGSSWESVPVPGQGRVNGICSIGSFCVWTGADDGTVCFTYDAFGSVDKGRVQASCPDLSVTDIAFRGDASYGALTFRSSDKTIPGGILYTSDGGVSWTEPVIPFRAPLYGVSFAGTGR